VRFLRFLLTLPPLSMSAADAKKLSGHSLRHLMPTLARCFGLSEEERRELARWAADGGAAAGRGCMPNLYSQEAEAPRVVGILRRLLRRASERAHELGGFDSLPAIGGWELFDKESAASAVQRGLGQLDAEASSSESDEEEASPA
jgi:hypothetical protein